MQGELSCGCECEAGGLPAFCATLPACSTLHLSGSLKFKPELGWLSHTLLPMDSPGLLLQVSSFHKQYGAHPTMSKYLAHLEEFSPISYFPKSLPSSLEQPQGFQSHLPAEDPTMLRPFPPPPAGYKDTMLLFGE